MPPAQEGKGKGKSKGKRKSPPLLSPSNSA
jgi:hypothetical protein